MGPRLAVLLAECGGVGSDRHLPSVAEQEAVCTGAVGALGGAFVSDSDVYVGRCGRDVPEGAAAVLETAVREGLYDGVVVADLGVLPVGAYQVFAFRLALVTGACELYVVGRPEVTLWGPGAIGFEASVASRTGSYCDDRHFKTAPHVPDPWSWTVTEAGRDGDVRHLTTNLQLLRRMPSWPTTSDRDALADHGRIEAMVDAAAVAVVDAAADMAAVEDAILAEGILNGARSFPRLAAATSRYRRAKLYRLVAEQLATHLRADTVAPPRLKG